MVADGMLVVAGEEDGAAMALLVIVVYRRLGVEDASHGATPATTRLACARARLAPAQAGYRRPTTSATRAADATGARTVLCPM